MLTPEGLRLLGNFPQAVMSKDNEAASLTAILERLARKMAMKVVKAHRSMTLEPMNPYERRIIHAALQDFNGVTTYSTGTEPGRRVVIAPDNSYRNRDRG